VALRRKRNWNHEATTRCRWRRHENPSQTGDIKAAVRPPPPKLHAAPNDARPVKESRPKSNSSRFIDN